MFGTLVEKRAGEYQEPCAGDSGGPLMYKTDGPKGRWVVIGWCYKTCLNQFWEIFGLFLHSSKVGYKSRKSLLYIFSPSKTSIHPIPGTVKGGGFDCRDGTVDAFDGHKEGVWNRVRQTFPHIG